MHAAQKFTSSWRDSLDFIVLIIALLLTFFAWKFTQGFVEEQGENKLVSELDVIENSIKSDIAGYDNALAGVKGLFSASLEVERDEFDAYFKGIDVPFQYPGIYSFVYVSRVSDTDLANFTERLKSEFSEKEIPGELNFQISEDPEHYIVNFIAYQHEAYPVAYGLDLKLDTNRRQTLERARDIGESVASAPLILRGPEKPGFIITAPIYKNGEPTESLDEKREAIVGFVNATFIYEDLLKNVFEESRHADLEIHIKDGSDLIYDSIPAEDHTPDGGHVPGFESAAKRPIEVAGRNWEIEFFGDPMIHVSEVERRLPIGVLLTGIAFSVLLFGIIYTLSSSQARAEALANQMTATLRSERDRVNLIVSSMGEGLLVVDDRHDIVMVNPVAEKLLEISQKDALDKSWSEITSTFKGDKKVPIEERSFTQAVQEGKTIITNLEDDHYYQTSSSRKFPIVSVTAPLTSGGKQIGAVKVFRDATHEKDLEGKLKGERDRVKLIISSMGEGLIVIDKDYRISAMNPKAETLLEVKEEDVKGKLWSDFTRAYEGENEITFENRVTVKVIKTGKSIVTKIDDDHYYMTSSGKKFPISSITAPLFASDGKTISGAVKVFRDATHDKEERALIEKEVQDKTFELSEEKARLIASINSLSVGFLVVDRETHSLVIKNLALEKILGLPPEVKLEEIEEKLKIKGKVDFHSYGQASMRDGKPCECKDIDYEGKILRIFISPIKVPETHEIIGLVALVEDTTETKLLERARDEFFSIASHELRTPLTAIRGNTSMIERYFKAKLKDPDLVEMIDDVKESSERLINIVNDFLDIGRLEMRRMEFKKEEIDVVSLIDDALKQYQVTGSRQKLSLALQKPEVNIPKVNADKDRAREVLVNLIGNGIKFTEVGGVTISLVPKEGFVQINITDTGRGISKELQKLLFRKFQQAGSSLYTRDTTKGTGLGLYISKLMVEGMGGKIWLEKSEVGRGSTFSFTLPVFHA
ncbi:MAG: putative sensor/response regulator hybrid [Candidatus Woesebacteria bacterium GW2011_GWB1_39_12]|uniref:histidine kinase n=2 Tax=Candidatus Woeseibacteriota TaxID=1752722 RepID=A0A0G0MD90_9BACT|nr:MAG: putative sensor/response regulator hybrid [Candidatus Woesebacteria bacterium GW2011_GWA1_39_12]KKR01098.1 MAG: putative sensor/response regulator hybrid [Candidatus Woesebacteria bacterium GW2011_GWB1_39_12]